MGKAASMATPPTGRPISSSNPATAIHPWFLTPTIPGPGTWLTKDYVTRNIWRIPSSALEYPRGIEISVKGYPGEESGIRDDDRATQVYLEIYEQQLRIRIYDGKTTEPAVVYVIQPLEGQYPERFHDLQHNEPPAMGEWNHDVPYSPVLQLDSEEIAYPQRLEIQIPGFRGRGRNGFYSLSQLLITESENTLHIDVWNGLSDKPRKYKIKSMSGTAIHPTDETLHQDWRCADALAKNLGLINANALARILQTLLPEGWEKPNVYYTDKSKTRYKIREGEHCGGNITILIHSHSNWHLLHTGVHELAHWVWWCSDIPHKQPHGRKFREIYEKLRNRLMELHGIYIGPSPWTNSMPIEKFAGKPVDYSFAQDLEDFSKKMDTKIRALAERLTAVQAIHPKHLAQSKPQEIPAPYFQIYMAGERISEGFSGFWGSPELKRARIFIRWELVCAWVDALRELGYDYVDIVFYGDWTDARHIADRITSKTDYRDFKNLVLKTATPRPDLIKAENQRFYGEKYTQIEQELGFLETAIHPLHTGRDEGTIAKRVIEEFEGEIETYNQWHDGEVYRFTIESPEGEHISSCGGFYGDDPEKNGITDSIDGEIEDELDPEADETARYRLKSGDILIIEREESPESPRCDDDDLLMGIMDCYHDRYNIGDKDTHYARDFDKGYYDSWEDVEMAIREEKDPIVILPLSFSEYGGFSIGDHHQVGFIYTPFKRVEEFYALKVIRRYVPTRDRRIKVSYEIVTPKSAAIGAVAEQGWENEEGEEFKGAREAAEWLNSQGIREDAGTWYVGDTYTNYSTGEEKTLSYHLEGFTEEEIEYIRNKLFPRGALHPWLIRKSLCPKGYVEWPSIEIGDLVRIMDPLEPSKYWYMVITDLGHPYDIGNEGPVIFMRKRPETSLWKFEGLKNKTAALDNFRYGTEHIPITTGKGWCFKILERNMV